VIVEQLLDGIADYIESIPYPWLVVPLVASVTWGLIALTMA
jgi:hypothetical protein